MRSWMLLGLAALSSACAGSRTHVDVSPAEVGFAAPPSSGAEVAAAAAEEPEEAAPAELTRAVLARTVQAGIGAFLANVELSPVLVRGRFIGFRLDRARGLRRWNAAGLDVRTGDVVTRVNGSPIERPEQAQAAFLSLAEASEVVIDVVRGGSPVTVRAAVSDAAPAAVSAASAPATAAR